MGRTESPYERLRRGVEQLLKAGGYSGCDVQELLERLPKRWEKHGDLVIVKRAAFDDHRWDRVRSSLWDIICDSLRCKRLALGGGIADDVYRTPRVDLVRGDDGWVTHVDNKIRYTFDVTRCMFSAGNVTEKLRVARMDCRGQVVVDLFAGIGYFTLPYLMHTGAAHVHACEWNPDAVEALRTNLQLNRVHDRCTIHVGDCRKVCPEDVADRVNLGLIPSSTVGWEAACRALNPKRRFCWMHVHENMDSKPGAQDSRCAVWAERARQVCATMVDLLGQCRRGCEWNVVCEHIEHVKSYGPHVDHVVMDLRCEQLTMNSQMPIMAEECAQSVSRRGTCDK